MHNNNLKYSVIIPVYNSEKLIEKTVDETVSLFNKIRKKYEIILVNDCSTDKSWSVIKSLSEKNNNIVSVNLLKNYGQHSAIYFGMTLSKGDYIITIDDDMQNPPSELVHLINKTNEGYDLVFGKFKKKMHNIMRRVGSNFIGYLNKKIFNKPDKITLTNVRIMDRKIVERILSYKTQYPYIPGLCLMFAENITNVEIQHLPRKNGKSGYDFKNIMKLVSRILFNYSSYPYRLINILGLGFSAISFFYALNSIISTLTSGSKVPGWTSLVVIISIFFGLIFILLSILGEYIIRLVNQVSNHNKIYDKKIIDNRKDLNF
jgi:glycosyltransferase involved in cell wall biosynthesis